MSNVIVVGGGAAGMMAAIRAAEKGHRVELIEKNEKLGKKVFITGKGRCNVTNACDVTDFFANVISNERFLYSAVYGFDNTAVMDALERWGCPLKVERGDRVFPVSDHSSDVIRALQNRLRELKVIISLNTAVEDLLIEDGQATGVLVEHGKQKNADAVVLCTGGLSYPSTGSTGDGFRMAERCGHGMVKPKPSLVPFTVKEEWCRSLQGLALKNVAVILKTEGKQVYREQGEMLFTHFGVSGPLILTASCHYQKNLAKLQGKKGKENASFETTLTIDLKPALDEEQLDKRLLREFDAAKNKCFKNALDSLFPSRLIPVMVELSGIDGEKKINEVTAQERAAFRKLIKSLPLTITSTRGFEEAIITQGGIKVKDVNPSTMESKLIKGLYFAGEMLDVDAVTGGFNLQIAWSTGYLAGDSIE